MGVRCHLVGCMDLEKSMKFVMAGNYKEYRDWCRERDIEHWDAFQVVYLSDFMSLMGRTIYADEVEAIGTWMNNPSYTPYFHSILATRSRKGTRA